MNFNDELFRYVWGLSKILFLTGTISIVLIMAQENNVAIGLRFFFALTGVIYLFRVFLEELGISRRDHTLLK